MADRKADNISLYFFEWAQIPVVFVKVDADSVAVIARADIHSADAHGCGDLFELVGRQCVTVKRTAARNKALCNWRTLPGQLYALSKDSASSVMPRLRSPGCVAMRPRKWRARAGMSLVRSRKGGMRNCTTFIR